MNTDRRIYLTTAIVAAAVATAITAFARWMPPHSTIGVSYPPESVQHLAYEQAPQPGARTQASAAKM